MVILHLNSFHKLIKDIFIMSLILLAIQLISRIFKVEFILLLKILKILFLIYVFLDLAIFKYELKYNEYNDSPNLAEFPIITIFLVLSIGYLCKLILQIVYQTFEAYVIPLFEVISSLDAVIIVAILTGFLTMITQLVAKYLDGRNIRKQYLSEKRVYSYSKMVDMVYKMQNKKYKQEEMIKDLTEFSKEITLWGSKSLVSKWSKFRLNAINKPGDYQNIYILEDVLNQLRKDMGVGRSKKKELLAFFINDIENLK